MAKGDAIKISFTGNEDADKTKRPLSRRERGGMYLCSDENKTIESVLGNI